MRSEYARRGTLTTVHGWQYSLCGSGEGGGVQDVDRPDCGNTQELAIEEEALRGSRPRSERRRATQSSARPIGSASSSTNAFFTRGRGPARRGCAGDDLGAEAIAVGHGEPRSDMSWAGAVSRARGRIPSVCRERRRAARWVFAQAEVGEMRKIGFADIGEAECRWPLGDPTQEDFVYCGLQVARGHAYCAGHCRLVYRWPTA